MLAIQTRYLGPTNTKPSRIVARMGDWRRVIAYPHGVRYPHRYAAAGLLAAKGLDRSIIIGSGELPDGSYCHLVARK